MRLPTILVWRRPTQANAEHCPFQDLFEIHWAKLSEMPSSKDRLYLALYARSGAPKMPGGEDK